MHSARFPRKALEEALPAGGLIEDFADHSRLLAETVKVSVLKLDPCPVHAMQVISLSDVAQFLFRPCGHSRSASEVRYRDGSS